MRTNSSTLRRDVFLEGEMRRYNEGIAFARLQGPSVLIGCDAGSATAPSAWYCANITLQLSRKHAKGRVQLSGLIEITPDIFFFKNWRWSIAGFRERVYQD